jgi:hypothetical protein
MKSIKFLAVMFVSGSIAIVSCGGGNNNNSTDSTATDTAVTVPEGTGSLRDTAPAAEMPPGAVNPGEDSARYGTGAGDSSRNRRP